MADRGSCADGTVATKTTVTTTNAALLCFRSNCPPLVHEPSATKGHETTLDYILFTLHLRHCLLLLLAAIF